MARKDDVVIQEPPMEEFGKRHSCIKRTCLSGCGCVIFFLIGAVFLVNFAAKERIRELKHIPENVEETVPLYDAQNVRTIQQINGKEKNAGFEIAAIIPKLFLSPLVVTFPEKFIENPEHGGRDAHISNIKKFLKRPLADQRNTVILEWTNLSAEPKFIVEYYQTELKQKQFQIQSTGKTSSSTQLLFEKNDINGAVYIQDETPRKEGTDFVSVRIQIKDPK